MPDEVVATPAAPASSPAPAASPSVQPAAPAPAAAASPSSPATVGTPAPSQAARPDWAPETVWDTTTNTFKQDALKASFEEANALKAFKAAEDSRKLTLPKTATDIPFALSKDFKAPEGVTFELNASDPLIPQAQQVMFDLSHGKLSPSDAMAKFADLYAAGQVANQQTIATARQAQINALGSNATARVDAITTWMDAKGYGALKPMLVTSDMVKTFEKMIADNTGGAPFSQSHREAPPEPNKINGIEKMDFRQARQAQDRLQKTA